MSERLVGAACLALVVAGVASCGGAKGFVRPLVGGHVVAVPPTPIVEDYVSRGEFKGGGFHADASAGVAFWRLELGMGMRAYTGLDYEGRCPRRWPAYVPWCQDRVVTHDALWFIGWDALVARFRLLPWSPKAPEARRLELLSSFHFGWYTTRYGGALANGHDIDIGLVPHEEWGMKIWAPGLGIGVAAIYWIHRHVGMALDVDTSWFFFDPEFGTMMVVGIKAGPVFRF
ncbi:MAG: hypothetical protein HY906_20380 [Deltaproteobacteria bacterium]|nr:hypothetical protein [Deltaproteobacteria bacterium]